MRIRSKINQIKLPEARENASEQGAIGFSLKYDWLRK